MLINGKNVPSGEAIIKKGAVRTMKGQESGVVFNVLIKRENNEFVARCLELGIVATAPDLERVQAYIVDLIIAQIDYAFSNDNLESLYHPAPAEVWREFFNCKPICEKRSEIKSTAESYGTVPAWIIAKTCDSGKSRLDHLPSGV